MDSLDPGVSLLSEDSNVGLGRPIPTETEFERLLEDSVEMETQHLAPSSPELATGATAQVVSPVGVLPDASSTSRTVLQGSGKVQAQDSWAMVGLSGRLEDLCRDLRRSVEHEFGLSERQLQAQHQAELEAQRLRHETLSHQQQVKIENLEMEVKTLSKKLETKQKQVKDALALTGHVRQNMLARLAFDSGFRMWQDPASEAEKRARLQEFVKDFAKCALRGIPCSMVQRQQTRQAALFIDPKLQRLMLQHPVAPQNIFVDVQMSDIKEVIGADGEAVPAVSELRLQPRVAVLKMNEGPDICILESSSVNRDRMVLCLRILKVYSQMAK